MYAPKWYHYDQYDDSKPATESLPINMYSWFIDSDGVHRKTQELFWYLPSDYAKKISYFIFLIIAISTKNVEENEETICFWRLWMVKNYKWKPQKYGNTIVECQNFHIKEFLEDPFQPFQDD